jgi:hypothetical protein
MRNNGSEVKSQFRKKSYDFLIDDRIYRTKHTCWYTTVKAEFGRVPGNTKQN